MGTIANSHHPNHTVQTRALHAYLRRRNANARHRDVLAAERKERARVRSEKGIRWGGRPRAAAACVGWKASHRNRSAAYARYRSSTPMDSADAAISPNTIELEPPP